MRGAPFIGPLPGATTGAWDAVPGDRHAAIIFLLVLTVDFLAVLQRVLDALLRRLCRGNEGVGAESVRGQDHARALGEIFVVGVAQHGVGLVGEGDTAINLLILLPE